MTGPGTDATADAASDAAADTAIDAAAVPGARAAGGPAPGVSLPLRTLRAGVWALPVHGVLLTLSTLTHQPDHRSDFAAYAQYVTTTPFLLSHLLASVLGAAIGVVGLTAAAALAAGPSGRPGRSLLAAALGTAGNVVNTALFGVAAFAQPAIGRAYEAGPAGAAHTAVELNDDVYGPEFLGTAGVALFLWSAGAVLLGLVLRRSDRRLRAAGLVYAVSLPLFFLAGLPGSVVQPLSGVAYTAAAVVVARRLPRVAAHRGQALAG
ncbi:hypothetical protein [Kineococcus glutinatus]|uniref:Uncharacterized protein n=1 Tax=Kineococcus glutinatus TaxID=1070872 RepID=A0ABP9HIY2_9ACTN